MSLQHFQYSREGCEPPPIELIVSGMWRQFSVWWEICAGDVVILRPCHRRRYVAGKVLR